jgi:tocopherol cyclase
MKYVKGLNKRRAYFEGWYFKHQTEHNTISFIPAFHINSMGGYSASLQIITRDSSYNFEISDFKIKKNDLWIKADKNSFSTKGISVNIDEEKLKIKGNIKYSSFQSLKYNAMGPFCLIPHMQCNHGILSLAHKLSGRLTVNNETIDFTDGIGYIEKDWGKSFPKTYLWTQCNWHDKGDCCIMLSIAHIPFLWTSFTGCICIIYYNGVEYRLATYLGVRIDKNTEREAIIQQGDLRLEIKLIEQIGHRLIAPIEGGMNRIIFESPACKVNYKFSCKNKVVFDFTSNKAGYESSIGIKKISK